MVSAGGFLVASIMKYRSGFPLDDAWIHQTYARNLIKEGNWSFLAGEASGGSTSPLWTLVMSVGFIFGLDPRVWSYLVGMLIIGSIGVVAVKWIEVRQPAVGKWGWILGIVLAVEWHLAWASVSGMETIAISLVVIIVFWQLERKSDGWLLGILIGIGIWLRPGAVTLFVPVFLYGIHDRSSTWREFIRWSFKVAIGVLLFLLPYLAFNQLITGTIWPNTFYAKQSEYAVLQTTPFINRLIQQAIQPIIGVGIVLVPGILISVRRNYRNKSLLKVAPLAWVIVHLSTYAWRLPVTYQHGRYAIPVIPILLVLAFEGVFDWIDLQSSQTRHRFFSRTWASLIFFVALSFWLIGAGAYSTDVAIIETEMVETAKWIEANTDADALVAAHDIGALGYFGDRKILDLAGLITPEVIPFIRDETKIAEYLDQEGADYLMTFPDWYPKLVQHGNLIYRSGETFSPAEGGENMAVYSWR
jgi:hypothetical protein